MARIILTAALLTCSACRFDPTGFLTSDGPDGGAGDIDAAPGIDGSGADVDGGLPPGAAGDALFASVPRSGPRLQTREWRADGEFFTEVLESPNLGSKLHWVMSKVQPGASGDELIVAVDDSSMGVEYNVLAFAGGVWDVEWTAIEADAAIEFRGFDLEFESSGDGLAVYSDGTSTPLYRRREGGVWSAPERVPINDGAGSPGPDPNTGDVQWIELERRDGTDQIGLAYADSAGALVAIVWNGSAWDVASTQLLEINLKRTGVGAVLNNRVFDLAFEASGDLLVAWARDFNSDVFYNVRDAGTGDWQLVPSQQGGFVGGLPHFIDLAARDDSDEIAACVFDLGEGVERVGAGRWSGASWDDVTELDDSILDANDLGLGLYPGQVAWLTGLDQAVCTYPDLTPGSLTSLVWTRDGGWEVGPSLPLPTFDVPRQTAVVAFPGGTGAIAIASDDAGSVYAATYDGSDWTARNSRIPVAQTLADAASVTASIDVHSE